MKRIWILLLAAVLCFAGCTAPDEPYEVAYHDQIFVVDPVNCTVTEDNGSVYTYETDGNSVRINYPNGASYFSNQSTGISVGGLNDDTTGYADGWVLIDVLSREIKANKSANPGMLLLSLFFFIVGGLNVAYPYAGWYLRRGWQFRDAEPSDAALLFNRIIGVATVILGVVLLFV